MELLNAEMKEAVSFSPFPVRFWVPPARGAVLTMLGLCLAVWEGDVISR